MARDAQRTSDPRIKRLQLCAGYWSLAFLVVLLLRGFIGAFVFVLIAVPLLVAAVAIFIQSVRVSLQGGGLRNLWPAGMVLLLNVSCLLWPVNLLGAYVRLYLEEGRYEEAMDALVAGRLCHS